MTFVSEQTIEGVIDSFGAGTRSVEQQIDLLANTHPLLLGYLSNEQFDLLLSEERDYFMYCLLILVESVKEELGELPEFTEENLGQAEERNWERWQAAKGKDFREKLDDFFTDYPQEDLLAFVEDSLAEEEEEGEESELTGEGRELMFIALKSVIDSFFTLN